MCFLDFLTSIGVVENAVGVGHKYVTQRQFRNWMSSLSAFTRRTGWVRIHKTIQFASESLVALLIIAKACWWQWWDLATNVSESVCHFQWLSLPLCILFNSWHLFSGSCVFSRSENVSHFESLKSIIQLQPPGSALPQLIYNFTLQLRMLLNYITTLNLDDLGYISRDLSQTYMQ